MFTSRLHLCTIGFISVALLGVSATSGLARQPVGVARDVGSKAKPCVTDPSQIVARKKTSISKVSARIAVAPALPKPTRTSGPRGLGSAAVRTNQLAEDLTPQLCESLKAGGVTADEAAAIARTMEREHSNKTHTTRKRIRRSIGGISASYTYEYVLAIGDVRAEQQPGVGYCSDFDWRLTVRNLSQVEATIISTTGEVGACLSPGFGLFYLPGLEKVFPYPVPSLCFDDGKITKLDLRNLNDEFEDGLVELVNRAFEKLQNYKVKLCLTGAPAFPGFSLALIPPSHMLVYCTAVRDCEINAEKLLASASNGEKK